MIRKIIDKRCCVVSVSSQCLGHIVMSIWYWYDKSLISPLSHFTASRLGRRPKRLKDVSGDSSRTHTNVPIAPYPSPQVSLKTSAILIQKYENVCLFVTFFSATSKPIWIPFSTKFPFALGYNNILKIVCLPSYCPFLHFFKFEEDYRKKTKDV